ncbi:MAG: septum formation initiator family protein [Lachnospiraceae bacterium]|nr:septum formation initiator family protein [Lachnospiraceae bacterium]
MSCLCITVAMAFILSVIAIDGFKLKSKYTQYQNKIAELQDNIDSETKRTDDLKQFEKFTKTRKYAEQVAEDKLGLVHDDEIIFKPSDEDQ